MGEWERPTQCEHGRWVEDCMECAELPIQEPYRSDPTGDGWDAAEDAQQVAF